ncbi:fatty acid CoA ligase family protein [Sandaracinus amylolyticus]|uniref:fatty acid CoA ligase family protein n=1 Tax=Sandaracinus amylolyticus TaxID=927083 RepID=UPI001EEF6269|nr:fatty acid CoA ligase family protein [Sandaracinus amylolyticus]UJR80142.1 AMP-dependent synthetase/ligase in alkane synthesis cluster [Sandaracinus amylolyticus]
MSADSANIAAHLPRVAREQPFTPAVFAPAGRDARGRPRYVHWTYRQLDEESDRLARGLRDVGIGPGVRTVLMVPPSLDLFAMVFALFKVGAPLVMVDPGIGTKHLGECLDRAEPRAFVGIPKAHAARAVLGWAKRTVEITVNVAPRWARPMAGRRAFSIDDLRERGERASQRSIAEVAPEDLAAILFTSGSTGPPKGALYRHATFSAQVESIRAMYDIRPGEIDLPTFPLFALFDPALGMVTVLPEMDATRPAEVDPRNIVEAIEGFGVTNMFGSPALLDTVSRWAVPKSIRFPSLRRVISAGAPVAPRILEQFSTLLPEGARIHTPYGATESLPVATIAHDEVLGETRVRTERGDGICVGRAVPSARVDVIAITDDPIARWDDARVLRDGEIGEIVVRGPQVTHGYVAAPDHTARAKIDTPEGIAHRMGDLGWRDERGRLWFCGRKSHRVALDDGTTLFTIPCEGPFNAHPDVKRSALVAAKREGRTVPVIIVEPWRVMSTGERARLLTELAEIARTNDRTKRIEHFLVHEKFPVDVRHNAKIRREDLGPWATQQLAR